jgi:hypothetical protein
MDLTKRRGRGGKRFAVGAASMIPTLLLAGAFSAPAANAGTVVSFCDGWLSAQRGCSRQASFSLNNIAMNVYGNAGQCVYRGSNNSYEPPSASGNMYCSWSGQSQILQQFYGYTGNPATFNNSGGSRYRNPVYNRN